MLVVRGFSGKYLAGKGLKHLFDGELVGGFGLWSISKAGGRVENVKVLALQYGFFQHKSL